MFCEGVNFIFSLISYNDFPYRHGFMMCFLGLVLSTGLFQIYMKRVKNKGKANVFVVLIAPMLCIASYFAACKYNEFGFYASQRFLLTVIAILLCVLVFICFMVLDRVSGAITAVAVLISSFMLSFALIAPHITEYVQLGLEEYIKNTGVNPSEVYTQKIFSIGTPAVRAAVKKAVEAVGIEYPVSLHSFRKTYGNWTYKIHKNEGICLEIIRGMFGHSDTGITRLYIAQTDEDAKRYANDLSEYLLKKEDGSAVEINNSPNVTIKSESFREILSAVFDAGANGKDKFETINEMITRIEREGF